MDLEFFEDALAEVEEDRAWYRNRSESAEAGFCVILTTPSSR
jgi:hypothetical protein